MYFLFLMLVNALANVTLLNFNYVIKTTILLILLFMYFSTYINIIK